MPKPSKLDASRFPLPEGRDVEVAIVRLEDGRVVARTPDELELLERPDELDPSPNGTD